MKKDAITRKKVDNLLQELLEVASRIQNDPEKIVQALNRNQNGNEFVSAIDGLYELVDEALEES